MKTYKATLSEEKGRAGLCVIFRHPVRTNPNGSALRVRRSLGTTEKDKAQVLVDQLNEILADRTYWTPPAKAKADAVYDPRIVNAFYDGLLPATYDVRGLRDEFISIPGPAQGYARGMLVGPTGAGKTSLARLLMGTDPVTERFPSTSTAKSTACDIEIVMAEKDSPFQGIVTFLPREQVRLLIDECTLAAAKAFLFDVDQLTSPAARLLEHSEQRFRLSYILGNIENEVSDESDEDAAEVEADLKTSELTADDRRVMSDQLKAILGRIEKVASAVGRALEQQLAVTIAQLEGNPLESFQELFEDDLREEEDYQAIVDDLFDAVESRFDLLPASGFARDRSDWPLTWRCESSNREEFIRTMNRFSSNAAANFGRLLTPLVQGMRVRGPFSPAWGPPENPKIVVFDGEGLGHTPESSSSISTRITERFKDVDAIILVDSAKQPMQAAPQALLRTLAASGHEHKLMVCFTHFDSVKAPNLPDVTARKQHVIRSLQGAISSVRDVLGRTAETALTRALKERIFFVSNAQDKLRDGARGTRSELIGLVGALQASIIPSPPASVAPVYDVTNLVLCVPQAIQDFREPWRARLRLPSPSSVSPEHWTRIKALSRHISELGEAEYNSLRPVADFIARLSENISVFLAAPLRWEPPHASEEMRRQVVNTIASGVFTNLHTLTSRRLLHDRVAEWSGAHRHRGPGSASERARDIENIYNLAAPALGIRGNEDASRFVAELTTIVRTAVENAGGRFT